MPDAPPGPAKIREAISRAIDWVAELISAAARMDSAPGSSCPVVSMSRLTVVGTDDSVHETTPNTAATIKNRRIRHLPSQLNVVQAIKVHHNSPDSG